MFPNERLQRICDLVNERGSIGVTDLSRMLDISEVTIRRDLNTLARANHIQRTRGGAMSLRPVGVSQSGAELIRSQQNAEEKCKIAEYAYRLINDKDTIFLDCSSTVNELAKIIAREGNKHITVVAHAFSTVETLSGCENVSVIMLGGEINYPYRQVEGTLTTEAIRNMRADKCFIGINGIDESFGFSFPRLIEIDLKGGMISSSRHSYMLADHTKFGRTYMARLSRPCEYVITDTRLPDYDYQWMTGQCKLIFADERGDVDE